MGFRFKILAGLLTLATSGGALGSGAIAQTVTSTRSADDIQTLQQAFEDAYYGASGTFFGNRGIVNSFTWFLGPFPENNIITDARQVHRLYVDASNQQNLDGPTIRTADLNNPFDTSLLLLPPSQPLRPIPAGPQFPPFSQGVPGDPQPAPRPAGPVRGLW
ncbi:hypothetical protein [Leptolyngbya sp. O-77]|uniref:hypothetical protein n=1 Tax=Leptolyngbya sp. O-77 TaxID=1080068 RepID=UPI00074D3A96|nr:hypothetical protein [Leptolyngbya sp. O-77]BAU43918.1 hypothetical protein O77CONTIG1_03751 [Leptolyngbya sp. O-77]